MRLRRAPDSPQPVRRRHLASAGRDDPRDGQSPDVAAHHEDAVRRSDLTLLEVGVHCAGVPDADRLARRKRQPGTDVRPERPHRAFQLDGWAGRVEQPVGCLDPLGIGDALRGLLDELEGAVLESIHRVAQQPRADAFQFSREGREIRAGRNGNTLDERDRACVQFLDESDDAHTRLAVARHQGPLDRGRTPPAGQERRVEVEDHMLGEERVADQCSIGAEADHIRLDRGHCVEQFRIRR